MIRLELARAAFAGRVVAALAAVAAPPAPAPVVGLDHVPIAVADLEAAAARYRALGFTLKPGRPHDNGIRNQHAKFADGTELELITAPEARDGLTTTYRRHLTQGDGPAFLALYAPAPDQAAEVLVPDRVTAPVARFAEGDVVLLPIDRQRVPGRPIVGATLRVRSLAALEAVLARGGLTVPEREHTAQGESIFLRPPETHGLWLEFREVR